jgi:YD repeat-containing protein
MTSAGGVSYGYDNNGNQTSRGASDTFSWDAEDRLTSATVSSMTTTFAYNGDGLRESRTVGRAHRATPPSAPTVFLTYDNAGNRTQMVDASKLSNPPDKIGSFVGGGR